MSFVKTKHSILDGQATVLRTSQSGDVWQLRMYIKGENQYFKRSLRTKDLDTALSRGREEAMKLLSDVYAGRKIFSATFGEVVDAYLKHREREVKTEKITAGRLVTITSQLRHALAMKGSHTKIDTLNQDAFFNYRLWRRENGNATDVTIRNEQATLNHLCAFAYREGLSSVAQYNFDVIRIRQKDVGKRSTFTIEQYDRLIGFMRSWVAKKNCKDEDERHRRLIMRDYVLILSNSLLRVGEAKQLKWSDVYKIESAEDSTGRMAKFAFINVRWETSKVRNNRLVVCRGGEYFERLKQNSKFTEDDDLLFCLKSGDTALAERTRSKYWDELMCGIGIEDWKARKLEWYSLRHFGITMRVKAGVNIVDLAKMAGTSVNHIENTYLKYSEEMALDAAMKNFTISKEGISE